MNRNRQSSFILLVIILFVFIALIGGESIGLLASPVHADSIARIDTAYQNSEEPPATDEPAPTTEPTTEPTQVVTLEPTTEITQVPTLIETIEPTTEPTLTPTLTETVETPVELTTEATPAETETPENPEATATVSPEVTEEPTLAPSRFDVATTCTEAGVEFIISNLSEISDEATGEAYALFLNAAELENPDEPPTPEFTEFSLFPGENLTINAGFGSPALLLGDETVYQLEEPCEEALPPVISVDAICTFESGVSFVVSNSGGAMDAEQVYSVTVPAGEAISGTFLLGANEQISVDAGYGQPEFSSAEIVKTLEEPCSAPAVVGGSLWNDGDGDGLRSETETGLANITVNLIDSAGFSLISVTAADGSYTFGMLPTASYTVQVDASTISPDYLLSYPAESNGAVALDVLIGGNYTVDFGYMGAGTASVSGVVWLETSNFGVRDADETGIAGVMVELVDAAGMVITNTPVDALTGTYLFSEIFAGDYTVRLVQETLFTPNGVTWNSDSEINYETSVTLAIDETLTGVDFGIVGTF